MRSSLSKCAYWRIVFLLICAGMPYREWDIRLENPAPMFVRLLKTPLSFSVSLESRKLKRHTMLLPSQIFLSSLNFLTLTSLAFAGPRQIECYKGGARYLPMPSVQQIVRQIPTSNLPATFHAGGSDDPYHLPQLFYNDGESEILITLVEDIISARGNWLEVSVAASQTGLACTGPTGPAVRGGWSTAGDDNDIKVIVRKRGAQSVGQGNGTVFPPVDGNETLTS